MAKKKQSIRNATAVAMFKRYGRTTTVFKDRRLKRQTKNSWRGEEY